MSLYHELENTPQRESGEGYREGDLGGMQFVI